MVLMRPRHEGLLTQSSLANSAQVPALMTRRAETTLELASGADLTFASLSVATF
jgi:Flp pilus assembly secretin CpaC